MITAITEPNIGPAQYTQCVDSQDQETTFGPKLLAGFREPPVQESAISSLAHRETPMMPDEAIEVFRLSRAERKMTSTICAVRIASINRLRGMETEGIRVVRAGDMV
jgi:hypothetical protein